MQPASMRENGRGCNQGKLRVCDQASLCRPERRISCVGPRSPRGWRVRKEGRRDADLRAHGGGGGGAGRADARARRNAGDGPGACLRATALGPRADRTSVVEGKSVAVRVALGGRRLIQNKTNK